MTDKQRCPISQKCKEFEDCEIKNILQQLKRKEQECEELTKIAKTHLAETFEMQKEINLLKIENEDLKEKLEAENEGLKKYGNHCFEPNSFKCKNAFFIDEKLKQALQEIKEIAESKKYIGFCKVDDILQKISEVEDE
jgi:phage pi2 protein 07